MISFVDSRTDKSVNAVLSMNYNQERTSDYDSFDDNMVDSIASNRLHIEPKITILQFGNTKVALLIDSGSVYSVLNESLNMIKRSSLARWLTIAPSKDLKTFANEILAEIAMMQTLVESKRWRIEDAEVYVVIDGLKLLIGRDLFDALGISVIQNLNSIEGIMISNITIQCPVKSRAAYQFPNLISRIGISKVQI